MTPSRGYIIPKEYGWDYRATAIAFLQRTKQEYVSHVNGRIYTLNQLKQSRIGNECIRSKERN
jgi:hypothetical protein